jgi:hypothetical protein
MITPDSSDHDLRTLVGDTHPDHQGLHFQKLAQMREQAKAFAKTEEVRDEIQSQPSDR